MISQRNSSENYNCKTINFLTVRIASVLHFLSLLFLRRLKKARARRRSLWCESGQEIKLRMAVAQEIHILRKICVFGISTRVFLRFIIYFTTNKNGQILLCLMLLVSTTEIITVNSVYGLYLQFKPMRNKS